MGQKQTFRHVRLESVLLPITDIRQMGRHVRSGPIADIGTKNVRRLGSQGKIRRVGKLPKEHAS
jgi:hypothetical protein